MLLPLSRTSDALLRLKTCNVSPLMSPPRPYLFGIKHPVTNQVRAFSRVSAASITPAGIIALIATTGTDRLVGTTILNAVQRRSIGTQLNRSSDKPTPSASMTGFHGTLIRSMQPQFLKIGFIKIHENKHSITFSDTMLKVELAVTDRLFHPELTIHLIKGNGENHCLKVLREALSSPEIREKEMQARHTLMEKYGMWKTDTPPAVSATGDRACLLLSLKQSIQFLGTHKKSLSVSRYDY